MSSGKSIENSRFNGNSNEIKAGYSKFFDDENKDINNKLTGALKTLDGIEKTGDDILINLDAQGNQIKQIKGKLDNTDSIISIARRNVTEIIKKRKEQIYIISGMFLLLIALIVVIVYFTQKNK